MSSTPFSELIKQAAEAKYVVVPAGDYLVIVQTATATKSSTGKDMIKLKVKVVGGPHKGASMLTQQTLTPDNPAAIAMFMKFLGAFGLDEEFLAGLPPREDGGPNIAAVCSALEGRVAVAKVTVGQWNDEDRNNVDKFVKPNAEQEAAARDALEADGVANPFGAPKAGSGDPFAAAPAGGSSEEPF